MPNPETRLVWQVVRPHLKRLHAQRIESPITPSFPDVEYVGGTVELKYEKEWPKRSTTNLNVKSVKRNPRQRNWWKRRCSSGGRCFVLLRVADDWLLFWGMDASELLCYSNKLKLIERAIKHWEKRINGEELCQILSQFRNRPQT